MEKTERLCKCGNYFYPHIKGQCRCTLCILENEPPRPPDEIDMRMTEFVEWFIYKWHNIRKAAAEKAGIPFEWEDGIAGRSDQPKSLAQIAREHGIKPRTLTCRLSRGWTLDEALSGKRNGGAMK